MFPGPDHHSGLTPDEERFDPLLQQLCDDVNHNMGDILSGQGLEHQNSYSFGSVTEFGAPTGHPSVQEGGAMWNTYQCSIGTTMQDEQDLLLGHRGAEQPELATQVLEPLEQHDADPPQVQKQQFYTTGGGPGMEADVAHPPNSAHLGLHDDFTQDSGCMHPRSLGTPAQGTNEDEDEDEDEEGEAASVNERACARTHAWTRSAAPQSSRLWRRACCR